MAVTFLDPGGDADFAAGSFWQVTIVGTPTVATDFVHGPPDVKSIRFPNSQAFIGRNSILADAGSRVSFYLYLVALPSSTATVAAFGLSGQTSSVVKIKLTSAGVLQLFGPTSQIGSNGATLATGQWYRISVAFTVTSTSVNRFELFVNHTSSISITNATLVRVGTNCLTVGNLDGDTSLDWRLNDVYVDDSSSLVDVATDVWVTAKRPFANGTTNGFTTQIGSSGSGYGTGHAPQVNERAANQADGWSMVGAGSAVTEEYTIEAASVGDADLTGATLLGFMGWVAAKSLSSETGQIIVLGASSAIALTSTAKTFTKVNTSTTYPGGGTDIGIITDTSLTTVSLYECGIVVAYIPSSGTTLALPSVALTAAVNAPTTTGDAPVTLASVALTDAANAPTPLPSLAIALASVAASLVANTPSSTGSAAVMLVSVFASFGVNTPAVKVDDSLAVSSVATALQVNAPAVEGDATLALASAAMAAAVNAPTASPSLATILGSATTTLTVNTMIVQVDASPALSSVAMSLAANVPIVSTAETATLGSVAATLIVNAPSASSSTGASVTLGSATATLIVFSPAVEVDATLALGSVALTAAVNPPSSGGSIAVGLGSAATTLGVNTPLLEVDCLVNLGSAGWVGLVNALILPGIAYDVQVHSSPPYRVTMGGSPLYRVIPNGSPRYRARGSS